MATRAHALSFCFPAACECKKFKQIILHKIQFECPHHLMVSHHWTCIYRSTKYHSQVPNTLQNFGQKAKSNHYGDSNEPPINKFRKCTDGLEVYVCGNKSHINLMLKFFKNWNLSGFSSAYAFEFLLEWKVVLTGGNGIYKWQWTPIFKFREEF